MLINKESANHINSDASSLTVVISIPAFYRTKSWNWTSLKRWYLELNLLQVHNSWTFH